MSGPIMPISPYLEILPFFSFSFFILRNDFTQRTDLRSLHPEESSIRARFSKSLTEQTLFNAVHIRVTRDVTLHGDTLHGATHENTLYRGTLHGVTLHSCILRDGTLHGGTLHDATYGITLHSCTLRDAKMAVRSP